MQDRLSAVRISQGLAFQQQAGCRRRLFSPALATTPAPRYHSRPEAAQRLQEAAQRLHRGLILQAVKAA